MCTPADVIKTRIQVIIIIIIIVVVIMSLLFIVTTDCKEDALAVPQRTVSFPFYADRS